MIQQLAKKFTEKDYQLYLVGGPVRDFLLNRPIKDWDFTTDAPPEEILKIIPEGYYNNQFGTVGIKQSAIGFQLSVEQADSRKQTAESLIEITTMRKEGKYTDSRHPSEVEWTTKIEEDLARRDFTINAMAINIADQPISQSSNPLNVDPFNGQADLDHQLIRAVGDPNKRFNEDALRLMRAVRFATQLNFNLEEKTAVAVKENASLIQNISWERIRDELFKILAADDPYRGIVMLRETGLLPIILPELERCFGIKQEGPKHDRVYDIGVHSILSLKHCPSPDPLVRFASLIHDVGKPDTFDTQENGNVTFYAHDTVGAKLAKKIGERLRFSRKEIDKLETLVRYHMFTVSEEQTDSAIRRFIKNVGLDNIDDMIAVRIADRIGGGTETAVSWRMEEFRKRITKVLEKPFSISDLKISGTDVMKITGLKPSREVGEILQKLFNEVLEDAEKNNREYLLDRVKQIYA